MTAAMHHEREHVLLAHFAHHTDAERAQRTLRREHDHLHAEIVGSQVAPEHLPAAGRAAWGWRVTWTLGALAIAGVGTVVAGVIGYAGGRDAMVELVGAVAVVVALGLGVLWWAVVYRRERGASDADASILRVAVRGDDAEVRAVLRESGAEGIDP
jgi:hypothetical protein